MDTNEIIKAAGGALRVAEKLDLSHQAVYQWKQVPPVHVMIVSEMSGIPPHLIRGDVFPKPAA